MENEIKLFKALGNKSRQEIVRALIKKPMYVEILAERLGLSASTVSFHLRKLQEVGLVQLSKDQYYRVYTLNQDLLNTSLNELILRPKGSDTLQAQREDAYRRKVLENFFEGEKLKHLPVQRKKKRIVLEYLASRFDWDKAYSEKELSQTLANFHEDFCTLRSEFICEKLFYRKDGIYFRMDG